MTKPFRQSHVMLNSVCGMGYVDAIIADTA